MPSSSFSNLASYFLGHQWISSSLTCSSSLHLTHSRAQNKKKTSLLFGRWCEWCFPRPQVTSVFNPTWHEGPRIQAVSERLIRHLERSGGRRARVLRGSDAAANKNTGSRALNLTSNLAKRKRWWSYTFYLPSWPSTWAASLTLSASELPLKSGQEVHDQ